MKTAKLVALVTAIAGLALGCDQRGPASRPSSSSRGIVRATAPAVLDVDAFMKDVDRYAGVVRVEGVVGTVRGDRQLFTLVDRREFARCGTVSCPEMELPVHWMGTPPSSQQTVRVEGQVKESEGKLVFVAQAVEATR